MSETARFTIGAAVSCNDGDCGDLKRVVVDPIARSITHLVVEARHRQGIGHLVPIALVDNDAEAIRLQCTRAEFEALEDAEETRFLPGASGQWDYEQEHLISLPYFSIGTGSILGFGPGNASQAVTYPRVPVGEVEVRRGDRVQATDGPIGRVRGLVMDRVEHQVTHVLLDEGHLWGKKEVAIPISAVTGVKEDGVWLNLTKVLESAHRRSCAVPFMGSREHRTNH